MIIQRVQIVGGSKINALRMKLMRPSFVVCTVRRMSVSPVNFRLKRLKCTQLYREIPQEASFPKDINDA